VPRKPSNAHLKRDLLAKTRTLLEIEGLDGLDVRKISKKAGCSIGTFYNHYQNMEDLVIQFNGETLDHLKIFIFETITPYDTPKDIFQKISENYISFAKNHTSAWLLLFEHPIKTPLPDWYQDKVNALFQKVALIFHPILRGSSVEAERAVKILWSSLHGICSLTLKNKLRFAKEQDTLELCQELFHYYTLGFRVGSDLK